MPSALVWGGLKAALECFKRYNSLFERVEAQLRKLTLEINRLASYEELFAESEDMEKLVISSYINILKFWATVEEQCMTSSLLLAAKALTSFSTRKLDNIVADIAANSNNIAKLVPIVQERLRRGEREDSAEERRLAGISLEGILRITQKERAARRRQEVRQWIQGGHSLNESNDRHQHKHEKALLDGTGRWIRTDYRWQRWLDLGSDISVLWLNGDPGVGKSVICASAARYILDNDPSCAVASQYFSFDEAETLSKVYRNLAEQLFCQLYSTEEEVSELVYDMTQGPSNEATASLKKIIEAFVMELKVTRIFLDGLDEEYSIKERWDNTSDVVLFFSDLARRPGSTLKLWCSTQRRKRIRDLMKNAVSIEMTASNNGGDIESLFASAVRSRDFAELDHLAIAQILADLKNQVGGNFLWASLMLDTISDASSWKQLQSIVQEGLPEDFEKYLAGRMNRVGRINHGLLSKVLSCLVYAKRPLLLDELCEAVSISDADQGQNLCRADNIYNDRIVDSCAPWIRVDNLTGKKNKNQVCTLTHSSIRKFLIKYPNFLMRGQNCEISPQVLAEVCLKYLVQKRYRKGLKRIGDNTFQTACGEDIIHHHLLGYCAKYWSRHLSDIPYSTAVCKRVEDFVLSRNFSTTLQTQSLLVGGQFVFQPNFVSKQRRKHLVRMFPPWFTEKYDNGTRLRRQYEGAIDEWGYFLDGVSDIKGAYPGEIDRCLWGTLPKSNFLQSLPSRYKCSVLESKNSEEFLGLSSLIFDSVNAMGSQVYLFRMDDFKSDGGQSQLLHEKWHISRNRRPKLIEVERIPVTMHGLEYYRSPLRYPIAGRAAEVAVSDGGQVFRVGHGLFLRATEMSYQAVDISSIGMSYIEEISGRGAFIAVASRRRITEQKLGHTANITNQGTIHRSAGKSRTGPRQNESESITTVSETGSDSENGGGASNDIDVIPDEAHAAGHFAGDSDGIESHFEEDINFEELPDDSEDFDDTASSLEALSAEDSASDGSRSILSSEVEDDGLWNDYVSDVDDAVIEDSEIDTDAEIARLAAPSGYEVDHSESSDSMWEVPSLDSENLKEDVSDGCLEPHRNYDLDGSTTSSSEESSDGEELAADIFERLIQTRRKADPAGKVSELLIFQIDPSTQKPSRIFHYSQSTTNTVFSSPPVFHPTLDLVVWPLGGESLLFANFTRNRYFTRLLGIGPGALCHISVQCRFSSCGRYLHIISLDGYIERGEVDDIRLAPRLTLKLHISTYELSKSKPERSPPRLIFRTSIALDREIRQGQRMTVPNLPYSFTWTPNHVYVTESSRLLKVIRISLFNRSGGHEMNTRDREIVSKFSEDIYLPASADMRKVQFIPHDSIESHGIETGLKKEAIATVIISSCNIQEASQDTVGTKFHLPQVVQIYAAQFGRGWEPLETKDDDDMKSIKKNEKLRVGELVAKFEKFDKSRDDDIIPFLG